MQPDIAHQCCDQLTAVRTGYPLISITLPYRGLKCRLIEVEYFFEVIRWQITSFKWSQAQVYFYNDAYQMCCVYVTIAPHYENFDFKLTSDAKIQPVFLKIQAGKTFSYHGHALVTLYVQFLCSDWSKFDRWVHVENFLQHLETCLLWQLKLTEFCVNLWCF